MPFLLIPSHNQRVGHCRSRPGLGAVQPAPKGQPQPSRERAATRLRQIPEDGRQPPIHFQDVHPPLGGPRILS